MATTSTEEVMPPTTTPAVAAAPREPNVIYEGDTVICQTSDGRMFFQDMKKDLTIRVGKKLTPLRPVIGARYGSIFEEQNKRLTQVQGGLFPDPVAPETGDAFVPASDNRTYADTNTAQKLSPSAIVTMRERGASGQEIIQKLVENSETWESKTEFSKQKYLKKKQQKYMPRVQFLKCTAESLCRTYRLKNPLKICNMREDSLAQILVYANIHAGAQVLVVDTCMGLVTGAIAERQAGLGRILAGYDGQQPANDILRRFNFDKRTLESIQYFAFKDVANFSKREEDVDELPPAPARDGLTREQREQLAAERIATFTPAQRKRYDEKKARNLANKLKRESPAAVRAYVRAKSDALVIASNYDPASVLFALLPHLARSKPFVIYSEFLEPLTRVFNTLQPLTAVIDLQLSETWTRENQVLPGRTHPAMTMSACSGYLLSGIKIDELPVELTTPGAATASGTATATMAVKREASSDASNDDAVPAKKPKLSNE